MRNFEHANNVCRKHRSIDRFAGNKELAIFRVVLELLEAYYSNLHQLTTLVVTSTVVVQLLELPAE